MLPLVSKTVPTPKVVKVWSVLRNSVNPHREDRRKGPGLSKLLGFQEPPANMHIESHMHEFGAPAWTVSSNLQSRLMCRLHQHRFPALGLQQDLTRFPTRWKPGRALGSFDRGTTETNKTAKATENILHIRFEF
mmetsp:Transcript_134752/g.349163  ORF Transcript_134752/g.349163 Transcript_134752/m.349163 type:complete len:134 (+) Transcript_134752:69-470(+)